MEIQNLTPIDYANQRVLTTAQLAEAYGTTSNVIKENFRRTKEYFQEGVDYFKVEGGALRELKELVEQGKNSDLPSPISKMASCVYLWTYQGCVRHCKMLNTQKAWDMFSEMERIYFCVLESERATVVQEELPFAQRYSAAARRSVARDFKESKKNAAPVVPAPALTANPELADKLIAIADKFNGEEIHDRILIHAANLLVGQELF